MPTTDASFWDNIAEKYAAQPVKNVSAFERKQAIARELLPPDARVLEIGCGTGSLALAMARHAGHIHALDFSAEMVRIANQKKQAQGVSNVTFEQGTLDGSRPLEPASFDSVWAFSLLHLVPDRLHVLRQVFELLKPGGTFVSSNVCIGESILPYGPIIKLMHLLGKAPVVHSYKRATILRELADAGFTNIEEKEVGANKQVAFLVARKSK